ncbi:hypothetical protein [Pedobacter agri]|uniref:hypothetical protein n=1 Tax=Pedobacter agri TaxID=454586 RepID=UPI0027828A81|nr:hypothetical protein [Pedobacter agri]MDQ1139447.1 hypothetical protein [Pedobacter agri]
MKIELTIKKEFEVKYLGVSAGVRYWEDTEVNGVEDTDGKLIPLRNGENWEPIIDIETGIIKDWPEGTTAEVHYKVCDDGRYTLLDEKFDLVKAIDGYVPKIMSPAESGYGDYIIMTILDNGQIEDWSVDLEEWEAEED